MLSYTWFSDIHYKQWFDELYIFLHVVCPTVCLSVCLPVCLSVCLCMKVLVYRRTLKDAFYKDGKMWTRIVPYKIAKKIFSKFINKDNDIHYLRSIKNHQHILRRQLTTKNDSFFIKIFFIYTRCNLKVARRLKCAVKISLICWALFLITHFVCLSVCLSISLPG